MTEATRAPWVDRARRVLLAPHDAGALGAFRVVMGLIVAVSGVRFLAYGWVDRLFAQTTHQLKYFGLSWVPALPAPAIHVVFGALIVLGLLVAAGLFYRPAIVLLTLTFTYVQLIDAANYLNHYYLVSLLGGLLCFMPAHRAFSLDALRSGSTRAATVPAWCTYLLRFQVAVVYVNAGLAKLNADWLLDAAPLSIWLSSRTSLPIVGPFLDERAIALAASWAGFLFDISIAFFLMARRTRPFAYVAVLAFHAATSALFPIGMFPVIMSAAALVFFSPSWPRVLLARLRLGRAENPPMAADPLPVPPAPRFFRAALVAAGAYALFQVAWPLRAHAFGQNVSWDEVGMRFSWRVMTREKNGSVTYVVRDPESGRVFHVTPRRYLTSLQERELSVQPDLILQLAHTIARDFTSRLGHPAEVRADAKVSWNGRPARPLVDPDVDLAQVSDGLFGASYVASVPDEPPIRLRPLSQRLIARRTP